MSDRKPIPCDQSADATEDRLGVFVAAALERLERREPVVVADLLADRPDLVERGRRLVRDLAAMNPSPRPVAAPVLAPRTLPQPFPGDYLVTGLLGEGTYGRVWLAEELHLPRQVALKTLRVPAGSDLAESALAALRKEAGFLVGIDHPNVVRVHGWRQAAGDDYLVLEYVPGGSFAALLNRDGPLPWDRAARYVADVAEGLLAAHAAGVVHRDVKPGNILWDPASDEAKLTDFGVAARLAEAGTAIGTSAFMAPEAFRGRASEASDVYGLAATLFRMVAGEVPFRGDSRDEQVRLIERGCPPWTPGWPSCPKRWTR